MGDDIQDGELEVKETERKKLLEGEEYANAFQHFFSVLEILFEDAEKQCEIVGNFNVAWELRDDAISGGSAVLNLAGGELSEEQRAGIERLLADVTAVPNSVVDVPNIKEEHVRAMSNPCWAPIRSDANELMSLLGPERKRVNAILGIKHS